MKAYSSFSWEQKEKIYSLARAGVSDEALCERYDVDEAILLRMYDEVLCELQRRRGYSGLKTINDFFRNVELNNGGLSFISEESGKPVNGNNKGSIIIIWHPRARIGDCKITTVTRRSLLA